MVAKSKSSVPSIASQPSAVVPSSTITRGSVPVRMLEHKPAKVFCIVGTLIVFIVTVALNALSSQPEYSSGIFNNQLGNISDIYETGITPASWTFTIWSVIYVWMGIWIVYCQAAICIQRGGDYLYKDPAFMSCTFFFLYIINLCLNVIWIVLFDRIYFIICFFVILFMVLSAYACIGMCSYSLAQNLDEMTVDSLGINIWLIRIFVQNGIGVYAAWLTVATHLNFDLALRYTWGIEGSMSDLTVLIILLVLLISWFALDFIALDRYTRYLITPYMCLVVAFCGVYDKQVETSAFNRTEIIIMTLLGLSGFGLLIKFMTMICRHCKNNNVMAVA